MSNNNAKSASGTSAQGNNLELHQQFKKLSIHPQNPKSEQPAQDSDTMDVEPKEARQDKGKGIAKAGPYDAQILEFDDNMGWQPDADMFDPLSVDYYEQATRSLPQVQEDPIGQDLADALESLNLHQISQEDRRYIAQLFMKKPYADIKLELEIVGIVYDDLTSEDLYDIIAIMTRAD